MRDFQFAQIVWAVIEVQRDHSKGQPYKVSDFMLTEPKKPKQQSVQDMLAIVTAAKEIFGGEITYEAAP